MHSVKIFHTTLFLLLMCFSAVTAAVDIELGKQKAVTCFGCHGQNGNSTNSAFPILAGQKPQYLVAQLAAFSNGTRKNAMMQAIAVSLTKQDQRNIAAFFANVKPISAGGKATLAASGKNKFSMCTGCHGTHAEGRSRFPKLAGQQPDYIKKQLQDFKTGTRKGGPMQAMSNSLSAQDMDEIAAYLGTL